ncbi:mitotic checkpoint serine/threonine-protein kinase BUB1 beta-like [Anthonomus grandis grandis]|uniref:mitotic checkpoint serine/threonine-protein kinase BUB1 beta-like n=1 Tax=Anthonomus grandis grandis TaxID=2921223 RepID=UPI0021665875|nr:mitotic checkpoint serine/threonine-protein kinase BUB1 beta-like [Anthonomus grandis grandis]
MDFDISKENIQPLRRGRNVQILEMALQAQTNPEYQQQLLHQRQQFELQIQNYQGDDPLENYYEYITWIEQSYPKNGHEGNCTELLELCLSKFENDPRYTNDRRLCKLWIKYNDLFPNPEELYLMMKSRNLCIGCADFYKAWAYYYEAAGDFQKASLVIEEGKKNLAQPYEELEIAHDNLIKAAGEHMIFGPNENRLQEKRNALMSLHTYRSGRVSSVRVPSGATNGITSMPSHVRPNQQLHIYEEAASNAIMGGVAPDSIITVAKRQEGPKENTMKPGPWTTVPHKKRVMANHPSSSLGFTVHEDEEDDSSRNFLPANRPKETLEDYSNWHVSLIKFPDPPSPTQVFGYPKHRVYADPDTEYSIEELRSIRYKEAVNRMPPAEVQDAVQSILVDDDEDCIVVVQDPPPIESGAQGHFQIYQASPVANNVYQSPVKPEPTSTVSLTSPWKSQAEHQNFLQNVFSKTNESRISNSSVVARPKFEVLEDPQQSAISRKYKSSPTNDVKPSPFAIFESPMQDVQIQGQPCEIAPSPRPKTSAFAIFEQPMQDNLFQAPAQGNAMKTAFRTLNADEVETGSRGGMDNAMAAQPALMAAIPFSDNSSSSASDLEEMDNALETSCTTQQFNFNLNEMKVSTPQSKSQPVNESNMQELQNARKMLFSETKCQNKILSTIIEEKSGFGSSSSSSGATTKSSVFAHPNRISMISEEHNSYLEQNMKANAALRRSLLGDLMEDVLPPHIPTTVDTSPHSPMQSTPLQSPTSKVRSPVQVQPLTYVPSDPFDAKLISELLDRVSFPGVHADGFIEINGNPRLAVKKEPTYIGRDSYIISKQLGKGQYGTVYKAYSKQTNCTVALKYQKPPNSWEFYICRELQARLAHHPLRDRFMDVSVGYFSDQASVLVSTFQPYGSLLDAANLIKDFQLKAREVISIYFTIEMLTIVKAMHEVKIIHADIKPDNFMVVPMPDNTVRLQLIDFGCSIDMSLFPDNATFTRPINTEDFICCEVRDGRPWSYHTDLFCVAATAHVVLLHEYIRLRNHRGLWSIDCRLPRNLNQELWIKFFSTSLNQQTGPADVATLEYLFRGELENRQKDLGHRLKTLVNMLKKN